jgi:hypothetical protein
MSKDPAVLSKRQKSILKSLIEETVPPVNDPRVNKLELQIGESCVVKASYHENLKKAEGPYKVMYTRLNEEQFQWLDSEGEQGIVLDVVFDTRFWELLRQ